MPCVPPIVVQITKDPQVTAQDLSTVDTFYSSAAPISVELGQEFLRKFPGKKLRNGVQWTTSCLFLRLIIRPIYTLLRSFRTRTVVLLLLTGYGMTEMTSLICGIAKNESLVDLAGSTGKLEPGVEARIIDCDTGNNDALPQL